MLTSNGYVLDTSTRRLGELRRTPVSERHDRDALWARLRADGYLFLDGFLDPDLPIRFRKYYFDELAHTGLVDPAASLPGIAAPGGREAIDRAAIRETLYGRIVPGAPYAALTGHPSIKSWFEWFFGSVVHLHKRKIIRHIGPGETGIGTATQAHYDLVYIREGSDRVLSMWIPLGDCPVEMGGLTYLDGSHHRVMADEYAGRLRRPAVSITADLPSLAEEYDGRWLLADYRPGDVVVHSAYIVHASTDNTDPHNRIRLSTDIRYQRAHDPIDWRWQEHWHEGDGL